MIIGTIKNGIVIDHIPAGRGMELYKYLKLDDMHCEVALIKNAVSNKLEKKDILKVNEVIDLNFDLLGYIAPVSPSMSSPTASSRRVPPEAARDNLPAFSSVRIPGASRPSNRSWSMSSS